MAGPPEFDHNRNEAYVDCVSVHFKKYRHVHALFEPLNTRVGQRKAPTQTHTFTCRHTQRSFAYPIRRNFFIVTSEIAPKKKKRFHIV